MLLNKDQILKADDLPTEDVPAPEWGGTVRVRGLTGRELVEYQSSLAVMRGDKLVPDVANSIAKLVAHCVIGEDGKPLFTQHDVHLLGEKSATVLSRVFEAAQRLSGMVEAEEAGKDSALILDAGSVSSSPPISADAPSLNSLNGSPPPNSPSGRAGSSSRSRTG